MGRPICIPPSAPRPPLLSSGSWTLRLGGWVLASLLGCAHGSPLRASEAYADALARGDLSQAYALTSPEYRSHQSDEAFARANEDPVARAAKAKRIRAAALQVDVIAPELSGSPDSRVTAAREALTAFLTAADARRFSVAYGWLSADLRARYTPSSLARDFSLAPDAGDRLRRAWTAVAGPGIAQGARILFPLTKDRAVELVEEADGFRVAALE